MCEYFQFAVQEQFWITNRGTNVASVFAMYFVIWLQIWSILISDALAQFHIVGISCMLNIW